MLLLLLVLRLLLEKVRHRVPSSPHIQALTATAKHLLWILTILRPVTTHSQGNRDQNKVPEDEWIMIEVQVLCYYTVAQTDRKESTVFKIMMIKQVLFALSHYSRPCSKSSFTFQRTGLEKIRLYSQRASSSLVKEGRQQGKLAFLNEFRSYEQLIILLEWWKPPLGENWRRQSFKKEEGWTKSKEMGKWGEKKNGSQANPHQIIHFWPP